MIETFTFVRTKGSPGTLWVTRPASRALGRGVPGITVAAHGTRRLDMVLKPLEEESRVLPVSAALADHLGLVEWGTLPPEVGGGFSPYWSGHWHSRC